MKACSLLVNLRKGMQGSSEFGNVVIRLGATYKMAYCREKCKEIWNVCMNEWYLI